MFEPKTSNFQEITKTENPPEVDFFHFRPCSSE